MKSMIKNSTLTLLLFFLFFGVNAQIPPRPNPPRLVNDFANLLSQEGRNYLERKLVNFDDSTSVQICIVTTFSLGEYGIDQFADELGAKWGVGAKGKDNGIVIVVKPKSKDAKGQARISVGYGLEGVIPDATAGQIVDYEMIPQFNNNKYFDGLDNATNSIIKFASGEYKPGMYKKKFEKKSSWLYLIPIIVIIIIVLLMKASSRKRGTNISSRGSNDSLFWILTALFMGGGGRGGGGFGGGGGSSGGDFGGFGGGDFGGGGASGDW
jgi:uncharacterized protein